MSSDSFWITDMSSKVNTPGKQYYRKTPSISRTESQHLNVSCLIMQLSLLNQL